MDPRHLELAANGVAERLALELRLCPGVDREDALQEAWLAALEGRDPARAVNTYAQRERRHRRREPALGSDGMRTLRIASLHGARAARRREARRESVAARSARGGTHG
jgi:hypothetical protein